MPRSRSRVVLQSGPKLDIRKLRIKPDTQQTTVWSYSSGLILSITVRTGSDAGTLILRHRSREQWLDLEGVPKPYGGMQFYVLCPRTGMRVATLWMPPGSPIFASRHAWPGQVAYATQFEDPIARAWSAKRRVVQRLGGTDPNDYDIPEKPRWMRWGTYDRLLDRYDAAEEQLDQRIVWALAGILRRYGPDSGPAG